MPIEIVTIKTKENGITSEQVNRLEKHIARNRLIGGDGFITCRFNCLTDDPTGLSEHVRVLELEKNEIITNEKWYELKVFDLQDQGILEESKTMFIDASYVPTELLHQPFLDGVPHRGHPDSTHSYRFTPDEYDFCEENDSGFLVQAPKWDRFTNTKFIEGFHQHNQGEFTNLWSTFIENASQYQETYADDVQSYIEDYIEENNDFILPMTVGIVGRYFINEYDKNYELNEDYDENVRSTFPKGWRGIGGEEDADYINYGHEYLDLTRQTSFLKLEGETSETPAESDRWLSLWIL